MLAGCRPWPSDLADSYRRAGWWRGVTLMDSFDEWVTRFAKRTALVAGRRRVSYEELGRNVDRMAAGLADTGLTDRDRVVVQLPNVPEVLVATFALMRIGAIPVMALPALRFAEISHIVRLADARGYVIPDVGRGYDYRDLASEVQAASPSLAHVLVVGDPGRFTPIPRTGPDVPPPTEADPSDVALFLLSGGTTGLPKLVPRTHDDYLCNIIASTANAGLDSESAYLTALPIVHNYALGCPGVLGVLSVGGRVILTSDPDPGIAFPLIERERVTVTGLVPAVAILWTEAAEGTKSDLSSLQLVQVGGSKLSAEAASRLGPALGCAVQQSFGMAEGLLSQSRADEAPDLTLTAQGRPLSPADEVRIVDADGAEVPFGAPGRLEVRGPYTIRGYYRTSAEEHAVSFTDDGFFRTGDIARQLSSGHLVIEGRHVDFINRGGEKVSAEEIENHLLAHPSVVNVAVVGVPDRLAGERMHAYVVSRDREFGMGDIRRLLTDRRVAPYKFPDRLEVVGSLPETGVGKVDKEALRALAVGSSDLLADDQPDAAHQARSRAVHR
jgi:2,3-dihydroxybenzoate-AMP ligase